MDDDECRRRFAAADHAYLATAGADAVPHLVPVAFELTEDRIVIAVDHKPKRSTDLRRLRNIRANTSVALLVDAYSDDWDALWWVRADGVAQVVESGDVHDDSIGRLVGRYAQYRRHRPTDAVIVVDVLRWSGWAAAR